eukprot:1187402-Alexandrium_andersonii.AAC.1
MIAAQMSGAAARVKLRQSSSTYARSGSWGLKKASKSGPGRELTRSSARLDSAVTTAFKLS